MPSIYRSRFLLAAALAVHFVPALAQTIEGNAPRVRQPNKAGHIASPLRYRPENGAFVIENGAERFNRPLYGGNTPFRLDGGDRPEFVLYLPGRGGNLRFAVMNQGRSWWLHDAARIVTRYLPGELDYEISDPRLGSGSLRLRVLADYATEGMIVQAEAKGVKPGVSLRWAFGGVSGERGARDGDIGTERVPISEWFQPKPEFAEGNAIVAGKHSFELKSEAASLVGTVRNGSVDGLASADAWNDLEKLLSPIRDQGTRPIAIGTLKLGSQPALLSIQVTKRGKGQSLSIYRATLKYDEGQPEFAPLLPAYAPRTLPSRFSTAVTASAKQREQVLVSTPDPYINAAVGALNLAADAVWDDAEKGIMHGAIAWRIKILGWRGLYVLDALGRHDRAAINARSWLPKQNLSPIPDVIPPPDEASNLSRSEAAINSNGDMSNSHYDMNTVFLDGLMRHLAWTGDSAMTKEVWPVLVRHLAWQKRLFRRQFDSSELPLYDSYAQIWASDDVQYNGGGTAYGSAYNVFLNRQAAKLADLLGHDAAPYRAEADAIEAGMRRHLWLPDRGSFGEYKDSLGAKMVHRSAGLWSYYHVIDSQVPTGSEAWSMGGAMLRTLPRLPVEGAGVPSDQSYALFSTTDWMPYTWSVNNVVMGENAHAALSLWQANRPEAAFRLAKSAILASMFMGISPGNVGTLNYLDVYRRESQRDFADGTGTLSRAIVEGLFGLRPDAMAGRLTIAPGLPDAWDHASIRHPDVALGYKRTGNQETWTVEAGSQFQELEWRLPARADTLASLNANGHAAKWETVADAVGRPMVKIMLPATGKTVLQLSWSGNAIQPVEADGPLTRQRQGHFEWLGSSGAAPAEAPEFQLANQHQPQGRQETVNLAPFFNDAVANIFAKGKYRSPRVSASLSLPSQGLGAWAGHVNEMASIDDAGLRAKAGATGIFRLPDGGEFSLPTAAQGVKALFVSNWSNYPAQMAVPLKGRAHYIRLLMAGSTNAMQSRIDNGEVVVTYADGGTARLPLRNPTSWWPIEKDYLIDDYQFKAPGEKPLRVDLKTGLVRTPTGERDSTVDGGAATILGLPLDPARELRSVTVRALSQDVVIGTIAATLTR